MHFKPPALEVLSCTSFPPSLPLALQLAALKLYLQVGIKLCRDSTYVPRRSHQGAVELTHRLPDAAPGAAFG